MRYSSFSGRIYVEKTPEQCFKSPLPPENQKAVREEMETRVPGQIKNKWTIGSNHEGLYNGVKPPEEGITKEKEETSRKSYCSIWKNTTKRKTFYLRFYPSDLTRIHQLIQNFLLGHKILTCLCVLASSAKFLTFSNCYKIRYQPNSLAHSLTNLLYWAYWAHLLFPSGCGLQFVTLQKQFGERERDLLIITALFAV